MSLNNSCPRSKSTITGPLCSLTRSALGSKCGHASSYNAPRTHTTFALRTHTQSKRSGRLCINIACGPPRGNCPYVCTTRLQRRRNIFAKHAIVCSESSNDREDSSSAFGRESFVAAADPPLRTAEPALLLPSFVAVRPPPPPPPPPPRLPLDGAMQSAVSSDRQTAGPGR